MNWRVEQAIEAYRNAAEAYIKAQTRMIRAEAEMKALDETNNQESLKEFLDRYDVVSQELYNATINHTITEGHVVIEREILECLIKLDVAGTINHS